MDEKVYIAQTNVDSRLVRWQAALRMLAEHPVLGVGPGGFRREYVDVSRMAELDQPSPVAHSMYLEVAAELGVVGLLLFVGIITVALVSSQRAVRLGADRSTAAAIQASLLAMLVAAAFLSEQYYMSLWAVIAIACGLHLRTRLGR
jgi:O-antigen ligase